MADARPFKNVFVLCTGRCGSVTFTQACGHFDNFTADHESRCQEHGSERLNFADYHIEVDNRLSWVLGALDAKYGDDAFYVHLHRDADEVAASYDRRWSHVYSMVAAYGVGLTKRPETTEQTSRDMVGTMLSNIQHFLKDKTHTLSIDIADPKAGFEEFAQRIGATGDLAAALAEFDTKTNTSLGSPISADEGHTKSVTEALVTKLRQLTGDLEHERGSNRAFRDAMAAGRKQTEQERERTKTANHKLSVSERARRAAEGELHSVRKKAKSLRKQRAWLAVPYFILLAPISIPLLGLWYVLRRAEANKKAKATGKRPAKGAGQIANPVFEAGRRLADPDGLDAALTVLRDNSEKVPQQIEPVFRSAVSKTDANWIENFSKWLAVHSDAKVELTSSDKPRFARIKFAELPKTSGSEPRISVIMPAFNAEETIEASVQSVLNQTWQNLELIVVNDKSADRTSEILHDMAASEPRLTVLDNAVNVGPYVSKNMAFSKVTGDFVTGHDADDLALPDRLARQVQPLIDDAQVKGVIGQMIRLDEEARPNAFTKINHMSADGVQRLAMISLMLRTEDLRKFGFWDSVRFGADSELHNRLKGAFGDKIITQDVLTMLCLNHQASLTNDATTGIATATGVSPIRVEYREYWQAWHKQNAGKVLHRALSNADRPFAAPAKMIVPEEDIQTLKRSYGIE